MKISILSDFEVERFYDYLDTCPPRDNLMMRLMLQAGLRVGEVAALNVEDVFRSGDVTPTINLPRSSTKGHVARRVNMPPPLTRAVEKHIKHLSSFFPNLAPTDAVFLSYKTKTRIGVRNIQMITAAISRRAIGRRINCHLLRHTFATILVPDNSIRIIQELLGHKDLSSTQIYTHVNDQQCQKAVDRAFTR